MPTRQVLIGPRIGAGAAWKEIVFSLPGSIIAGTKVTPRRPALTDGIVLELVALLDTAGGSDTIFDVLVEDASLMLAGSANKLIVPSGGTSVVVKPDYELIADPSFLRLDRFQLDILQAGTGAKDGTVIARYLPR